MAIIPLILNLIVINYDYKMKTPFVSFSLAILLVFSTPHFLLSIFSTNYSYDTFFFVTVHASVFFVTFLFTRVLLNGVSRAKVIPKLSFYDVNKQHVFSLIFLGVFLLTSLYSFEFSISKILASSWVDTRNSSSYITLIGSFFLYSASSCLLLSLFKKSISSYFIILISLIYIVVALKTRNYLIAILIPVLINFIINGKLNAKKIFIGFLLSTLIITLYSAARNVRHIGSVSDLSSSGFELSIDTGEFEVVDTLYYFIEKDNFKPEVTNSTLIRILTIPLPSFILPFNKPEDLSYTLWNKKTGIIGVSGSLHPTVIGDSILNMRSLGSVLYAVFYGVVFFSLELFYRYSSFKFLFFGLFCTISFYIARGAVYNGFIILFVGMVILITTNYLTKFIKRKPFK